MSCVSRYVLYGSARVPTLVALVVCLVEGGKAVFCVFLGEGATRGWAKGDKGRDDIKVCVWEYLGTFRVPNQYATALREHWWSVLAESPLFAVITITITIQVEAGFQS